ncbi:hypothetical protein IDJ77_11555 [Mucilaginibacter sp. ZT4R22]|uniref:Uncharacterized protein n=1 Tax=Mucilaginibacter pankratovii TaxID=2772110 RepID=A0ABR7WQ32_9SPHI|nr:hypothetical protein [Mucilaginibacter pankratovii]MBD1364445.1 hypothetical protein [Mucilaginibacter pankratovii]
MEPIIIKLPSGKYLSEIEPFKSQGIDTDSQYHKTVPGVGITTFAIRYFESNLIETLPNRPVVEAKGKEHNELFPERPVIAVYQGVTIAKIKAYLLSDIKYKKIVTTPEGFIYKVVEAFREIYGDLAVLYAEYFMLIDESERIVTDVSYRGDIAAPLNHFFYFKRRALVSATTLPFSDLRFNPFKNYIIVPQFDYSVDINILNTNNVIESLKMRLAQLNSDHVSIFFNSTKGINAIVKALNLKSNYMAFCSEDSVVKLIRDGVPFERATDDFHVNKMLKSNFFTSRYFSAIDIKVDYKPDVILITDVFFAAHSILDPKTEIIQIAGRFRNGINSYTHITNFNPNLQAKTPKEARFYINGHLDAYQGFVQSYKRATNLGERDALQKAITDSKAHSFYDENGNLNDAMVDNFIHEERVKEYYKDVSNLKSAYAEQSKYFVSTYSEDIFDAGDKDLFDLKHSTSKKEMHQQVARMLYRYKIKSHFHFILFKPTNIISKLREQFSDIALGVDNLDESTLEQTDFVGSKIKKAVSEAKDLKEVKALAPHIYQLIEPYHTHVQTELVELMHQAYQNANVKRKVVGQHILLFFEGDRSTELKKNVYKLRDRKFEYAESNQFF